MKRILLTLVVALFALVSKAQHCTFSDLISMGKMSPSSAYNYLESKGYDSQSDTDGGLDGTYHWFCRNCTYDEGDINPTGDASFSYVVVEVDVLGKITSISLGTRTKSIMTTCQKAAVAGKFRLVKNDVWPDGSSGKIYRRGKAWISFTNRVDGSFLVHYNPYMTLY